MIDEWVLLGIADLLLLCLALVYLRPDPDTPTTQAFSAALAIKGMNSMIVLWCRFLDLDLSGWLLEFSPANYAAILFAEWFRLVMRTATVRDRWSRIAEILLRLCQLSTLVHSTLVLVLGEMFEGAPGRPPGPYDGLLLLSERVSAILIGVCLFLPMLIMMRQQPDPAERRRIAGTAWAVPFFTLGSLSGSAEIWAAFYVVGALVVFSGSMGYYVVKGERSQFFSRFLSQGVGKLVQERGLQQALQRTQMEITVLCCDLRGFTAFTEKRSSADVVQLLEDYYNAVCAEVAHVGGTVKDFAGDGILILVGAPVPQPDHAQRGLELARASREAARRAIAKWSTPETPLGIGVGVASGRVTVGVIDAAARLEYTAVGTTVNLAARLCGRAADGEVLVSERTSELAGRAGLEPREPVALKGIGDAVPYFGMAAAAA